LSCGAGSDVKAMTQTACIRYVLRKHFHDAKAPRRSTDRLIREERPRRKAQKKGKDGLAADLLS
jgi:hypothetical protein